MATNDNDNDKDNDNDNDNDNGNDVNDDGSKDGGGGQIKDDNDGGGDFANGHRTSRDHIYTLKQAKKQTHTNKERHRKRN